MRLKLEANKPKSKNIIPESTDSMQCPKCRKQFRSKILFNNHRYLHQPLYKQVLSEKDSSKVDYLCTFCEVKWESMELYTTHSISHKETCSHCNVVHANAFLLGIHLAEHDPEERVSCPFCEFKTVHPYSYRKHLFTKHYKLRILRCEVCGVTYSCKKHLEEHVSFVHQNMEPHRCVVCLRTFVFQTSLIKHQVNSHRPFIGGEVPSNYCIICKRTFVSVNSLEKHLADIHSKPRKPPEKHICDVCGKVYMHRQSWLLHTKGHSGLLPYKCKMCDKRFTVKAFLTQHEKNHSEEKQFFCEVCGFRFKRKEGLRRHLTTHTDVKPFVCENCGKRFRRRAHRRLHMNSCNKRSTLIFESVVD